MQNESSMHRPHDQHGASGSNGSSHTGGTIPGYITRLIGVWQELLGKTQGIKERLCQEVAAITQQRARLIFHDRQSSPNIFHDLPCPVVTFPVEFDKRNFGILAFQQEAAEDNYPPSLTDIELLARTCGWVLSSLEASALQQVGQTGKLLLPEPLSKWEREVLELMGRCSNEAIAQALDITVATVIKHKQHILAKLGVSSETEAILVAYRLYLYFPLEGIISKASESR